MKRAIITLTGIACLAVGAILIGKEVLGDAGDRHQARQKVLTGGTDPRLEECMILEDDELPEGMMPPGVGDDTMYIRVVVLYPSATKEPDTGKYRLVAMNGHKGASLHAKHVKKEETDEGFYVDLVFKTDSEFEYAALARGASSIIERVALN